jgi:hypothetical protein
MAILTIAEAKRAGKRAGLAAASWKFDGNTTQTTYEHFLNGLADGDPEVLDGYAPPSWLSGEYAGESLYELLGHPDTPKQEERIDAVAQAYEYAAEGAYWHELERAARQAVGGRRSRQRRRFNPPRTARRRAARRVHRNPPLVTFGNPPRKGQVMSKRVYELAYKHVDDSKAYKHKFAAGVCLEALPDGSIRVYSKHGKRLWGDF